MWNVISDGESPPGQSDPPARGFLNCELCPCLSFAGNLGWAGVMASPKLGGHKWREFPYLVLSVTTGCHNKPGVASQRSLSCSFWMHSFLTYLKPQSKGGDMSTCWGQGMWTSWGTDLHGLPKQSAASALGPSMWLQMAQFHSSLWPSNIPLYKYTTSCLLILCYCK